MKTKRILSLILAISMIITSFMAVYADETAETVVEEVETVTAVTEDDPYYRAVTVLKALGIMEGKSEENFGADDYLTRAEVSAIAIRFLGLEAASKTGVADSGYSDVADDHWAKYYIDMASALGIIHGNGDGTFEPDSEITAEQAIKIMVCAMGYEPKAETLGEYPASYLTVASSLGMLRGVTFSEGTAASIPRWQIATLVYNSLDKDLMDVMVYGENNYSVVTEDMTALGVYHKVEKASGTVTATYESAFEEGYRVEGDVRIDDTDYVTELEMHSYLGQYVDFYYIIPEGSEKGEIIAVFTAEKTEGIEISFDDVYTINVTDSFGIELEYYEEDGSKIKRLSTANPIIMYNGKTVEFETTAELQTFLDEHMNQGQLVIQRNTKNDFQDVVFVENYDAYVVSNVDAVNKRISYNVYEIGRTDTATLDLEPDDSPEFKMFVYNENGEEIDLSEIAANDVIMVYASLDNMLYKIYQSKKQVTGVINRRDKVSDTEETEGEGEEGEEGEEQPSNAPYWETLSTITFDDFVLDAGIGTGNNKKTTWKGQMTVQDTSPSGLKKFDRTIYLSEGGYYYYEKGRVPGGYVVNNSPWAWGKWTNITTPSAESLEGEKPDVIGDKVFLLDRKYHFTGGNKKASPDSTVILSNIFDESKVALGDKVRITAWVYAEGAFKDYPTGSPNSASNPLDTYTVTMWLTENADTNKGLSNYTNSSGGNVHNTFANGSEDDEIVLKADAKWDEWVEISFEYDINSVNKGISSIKINNDNWGHNVPSYPNSMYVSGVKVEKYVDPSATGARPELTVDPTDYDIYIDGVEYKTVTTFPASLLEMGKTVTVLLDNNGKIAGYIRSLAKTGYGLLMDVGIQGAAFGTTLAVKILGTDNVITTYNTTEEVKAWNGTDVVKMPAEQLVTYDAEDPKTGWHLWSYDNAENFEAVPRTWLSDDNKSNAASRKVVYYETNGKGEIDTILVPSMPEEHEDTKIFMVRDFEYGKTTLYHSSWPRWLTLADAANNLNEPVYRLADDLVKWFIHPNEYNEEDYIHAGNANSGIWEDNVYIGRPWHQAQLYRVPGSKTIDFMVMNGEGICGEIGCSDVVVVNKIEETEDGYTFTGWKPYQNASSSSNHTYTGKIKKNLRLMENIWTVGSPDENGTVLTWDNVAEYSATPENANGGQNAYQCSYEALGMETPYVEPGVVETGDVVRLHKTGDEIDYFEVIRRKDNGLVSAYSAIGKGNLDGFFSKEANYLNGQITEVNIKEGYVKVKGYYWPSQSNIVSAVPYLSTAVDKDWDGNKRRQIAELETIFRPTAMMVMYDEATDKYRSAIFEDLDVGDFIFTSGVLSYPRTGIIFKNHNK